MDIVLGIDVVWTVVAALGIGVAVWAMVDSLADRRALRADAGYQSRREREVIVTINLRAAGASVLLHSFFFLLGILALQVTVRPRPTLFYILLASGYILVAATNVRAVGLNQLDRLRLRQTD